MRCKLFALAAGLATLLSAPLTWAEDLAVIIANEGYENYPRVRDDGHVTGLKDDFENAGFDTLILRNLKSDLTQSDANSIWRRMNRADKLIVVISGHVVREGQSHFLLSVNADRPNAFTLGQVSLPLDPILTIAARKPGEAILAVATDGTDLQLGLGTAGAQFSRDVPQGVLLVNANQRQIAAFIAGDVLNPGRVLFDAVKAAPNGFFAAGYLPRNEGFLDRRGAQGNTGNPGPTPNPTPNPAAVENDFWRQVVAADTASAYRVYLNRYPSGRYAGQARARITALQPSPADLARQAEEALGLNRNQQRRIQRHLELLGHQPGSIDGIFGRNTRNAIGRWQSANGIQATGYLNANQISQLSNQAEQRAAQLQREADERRALAEKQDRKFWSLTGADNTADGFRRYLNRYPDGLFSKQAREGLAEIERTKRRAAEREEREAWDRAVLAGTVESYTTYVHNYPNGRFVDEAKARIENLSNPETPKDLVDAARQEEERLSLNGFTRQLIEAQLKRLNFDPGKADGRFTSDTRRALRQYQRSANLTVTGYVTRDTIVRLLASSLD